MNCFAYIIWTSQAIAYKYIGWCWHPLLFFLASRHVYRSHLCQSLDGVKSKWVLHNVPRKARVAGYSLCSPIPGKGNSLWMKSFSWSLRTTGLVNGTIQAGKLFYLLFLCGILRKFLFYHVAGVSFLSFINFLFHFFNWSSRCSLLLAVINVVSVGAQPAMKSEFPSAGLSPTSCVGGRGRVVRCLSAALPVTEVNHLGKSQPREHHFSWPEGWLTPGPAGLPCSSLLSVQSVGGSGDL